VAELIGAPSRDVIFTSCATESKNTAIASALKANPTKRHIVTSQVEHSSVLNFCMALEKETGSTTPAQRATPPQLRRGAFTNSPPDSGGAGALATGVVTGVVTGGPYRVTYLPVDREGLLNLADLEAAIKDETAVVPLIIAR
jgi:cysteine sulfinate desulfinase/cysteine desulfurase-like protein